VPKPIARWNPARDVWETQTTGLFCEHSDVWSETWPPSGMTRAGTVYALPTSEPRTDVSACSSLPTPTARDWKDGACADADVPTNGLLGRTVVRELLPTPRATDGTKGGPNQRGSSGDLMLPSAAVQSMTAQDAETFSASTTTPDGLVLLPPPTTTQRGTDANLDTRPGARANLHNTVEALLPTPSVSDGTGGHRNRSGDRKDELLLPGIVLTLLPTPTATPYGSNQSASPGAAVRPSLDTLALTLLPTPVVTDATGTRNRTAGRSPNAKPHAVGTTLTDALCGVSTNPRFAAGNTSSDDPPPHPPN
jgi:hypothetical protein